MTKSYSGLQRDDSKPRRGGFLNNFLSILAVQFVFVIFNFTHRNPRKAHKQSISTAGRKTIEKSYFNIQWTSLWRIQIRLENYVKVIQQRGGGKIKIRKKDKNPESSAYAAISCCSCLHRSTDKHKQLLLLMQGNTQEGCLSTVADNRNYLTHVPANLDLSLWSICTNLSQFFICLLWLLGQWALTGIFCIYSILMTPCNEHAGIGFWSLNKLSKIWRNLS